MDFEPLIKGIADAIGATGRIAEESAGRTERLPRGGTPYSTADVERWLCPLSPPEKQVPLIHDYLRGHAAINEAQQTGATHVQDVSVPVWQSAQKYLQSQVDTDPEVQQALRDMFVGRNTPKD